MNTKRILMSLLVMTVTIAVNMVAFAQTTPPAQGTPPQSNKGGAVRGLDRADQVAGEHGQQGREKARAAQEQRENRPGMDRPERPQRGERPGR